MNLSREFSFEEGGQKFNFLVTYNTTTHAFQVVENSHRQYELFFDMATRTWGTKGEAVPSIAVEKLAQLVQQSFGVFV